jgi:hypothetical protein
MVVEEEDGKAEKEAECLMVVEEQDEKVEKEEGEDEKEEAKHNKIK